MRLQRDWCDIQLVIEAAIACLPQRSAARISVACDPGLPAVWADHDRLEQVFVNLLSNAVGHNPPGTLVRISGETPVGAMPAEVLIRVADDGDGMPADLLAAPFEPARRRAHSGGAGLGLSIAKGIVDAHGGRIDVQCLSRGTCFRIHLPVEADRHA
jgi:signal transduction histidine kinase